MACGTLPKEHAECPAAFFARGSGTGALSKEALEGLSHGLLAQGTPSLQLLDQVGACAGPVQHCGSGTGVLSKEALEGISHSLLAQGTLSLQLLDPVLLSASCAICSLKACADMPTTTKADTTPASRASAARQRHRSCEGPAPDKG